MKLKKQLILFCPSIADGGLEKTLKIYSNFLKKDFRLILVTNTLNLKRLRTLDLKLKIFNPKNNFFIKNRFLNNIYCIFLILYHFKRIPIFSLQDHFFLLLLKKLKFDFKLIVRTMSAINNKKNKEEFRNLKKDFFVKNFILSFYKYADLVITFSNSNKYFLQKHKGVKNVQVVYNYFQKHSGKKRLKKEYNIFFIGRLVPDKDPLFFLKNSLSVIKEIPIKINIIGKGPCETELKCLASAFPLKVKFFGWIENPLIKFSKIIDLLCITSKYDGTPNILGEAMAYKIPCLAPRNIGLSNFLLKNGKYGELYKANSNKDFQKKIIQIIKNYKIYINKAIKGYNSLDRFNKKNTIEKLNKYLIKLLYENN